MVAFKKFFIDVECESKLHRGLPYYASGIILEDYRENGEPRASWKDFVVSYIDPWGNNITAWRGMHEIKIIEVAEVDYEYMKFCLEDHERVNN